MVPNIGPPIVKKKNVYNNIGPPHTVVYGRN